MPSSRRVRARKSSEDTVLAPTATTSVMIARSLVTTTTGWSRSDAGDLGAQHVVGRHTGRRVHDSHPSAFRRVRSFDCRRRRTRSSWRCSSVWPGSRRQRCTGPVAGRDRATASPAWRRCNRRRAFLRQRCAGRHSAPSIEPANTPPGSATALRRSSRLRGMLAGTTEPSPVQRPGRSRRAPPSTGGQPRSSS